MEVGIGVSTQLSGADGTSWIRGEFADGSALARRVAGLVQPLWSAWLLAERPPDPPVVLDRTGRGCSAAAADHQMDRCLADGRAHGLRTLVVEDDLGRRGDSALATAGPVCFVEDRIIRWTDVQTSAHLSRLLTAGSSGSPLIAFASSAASADLGLAPGVELTSGQIDRIIETVQLVVTSVYDGEAYLVMSRS